MKYQRVTSRFPACAANRLAIMNISGIEALPASWRVAARILVGLLEKIAV
jgi:hypothetical protein